MYLKGRLAFIIKSPCASKAVEKSATDYWIVVQFYGLFKGVLLHFRVFLAQWIFLPSVYCALCRTYFMIEIFAIFMCRQHSILGSILSWMRSYTLFL